MRKTVLLFLAVLFMTVPAMAVPSNVDITCTADGNQVTVSYASDANLIRAFGLDVNVVGANITKVVPVDANYRIYPGQIVIVDGNVTDYNTPYAPGDLGDANVTIEMGSLYTDDPCYAGDPNAGYNKYPGLSGTLLKFYVSGNCTYAVTENPVRGGIVMEDPTEEPTVDTPLCSGSVVVGCTVPNVVGMTQADANVAIDACNLNLGVVTEECNDTVANGLVLRSNPVGGVQVACDSNVDIVKSLNPPLPGAASGPTPVAGANCVPIAQVLSWTAGANTATQDVYFGTTNPPAYRTTVPVGTTTYDPCGPGPSPAGDMTVYTLYYWRIDEKNVCNEKTTGTVWCFATGPQAGKACCNNEAAPCLGNINTDTRVNNTDIGLLVAFVNGLPLNRCNTAPGSLTCPPCRDMNGSGRVDNTDIGVLVAKVAGWALNRHNCPYPSCSNPP